MERGCGAALWLIGSLLELLERCAFGVMSSASSLITRSLIIIIIIIILFFI